MADATIEPGSPEELAQTLIDLLRRYDFMKPFLDDIQKYLESEDSLAEFVLNMTVGFYATALPDSWFREELIYYLVTENLEYMVEALNTIDANGQHLAVLIATPPYTGPMEVNDLAQRLRQVLNPEELAQLAAALVR
jgi:hypothetical protein